MIERESKRIRPKVCLKKKNKKTREESELGRELREVGKMQHVRNCSGLRLQDFCLNLCWDTSSPGDADHEMYLLPTPEKL